MITVGGRDDVSNGTAEMGDLLQSRQGCPATTYRVHQTESDRVGERVFSFISCFLKYLRSFGVHAGE